MELEKETLDDSAKYAKWVFWLILLTTALRIFIAGVTGLGYGESYYAMGAVNPQLSYFDQPPLAFWIASLSMNAFGSMSALSLRLPSVLFFAGTCYFMYCITRRLYSARAAFYAVLAINLSAVFTFTGSTWMQPDAPLMFFWMATTYCLINIFFHQYQSEEEKKSWRWSAKCWGWWLLAGVMLGLTTLSKYHAGFLFAGVGIFALSRKEDRNWVWHPGPYLAFIINMIISLPILLWNNENGWVSFLFQAGRAGAGEKFALHFNWFAQSFGGQAMWLLPWIWLPLIYALYYCFKQGASSKKTWFFACTAILPIAFFTIVTLWSNLGFHFHWQAPGYMMLFPPLGMLLSTGLQKSRTLGKFVKAGVIASVVFTVFFGVILQLHTATGFWSFYGPKWFGQLLGEKYDPTMEGYDYDDLMARFKKEGWLDNDNIFVCTDRWYLAGKIDWALRGKKAVFCFSGDPRNVAFFNDQKDFLGKDAIYITHDERAPDYIERNFASLFESLTPKNNQEIIRGGVPELTLKLFYGKNFNKPFPRFNYGKGINDKPRNP